MKNFLSAIFSLFLISCFSQELIPNFEHLSDSAKDNQVLLLLKENRSTPIFEDRINKIKEIIKYCRLKNDLPTEALAISNLCITYIETENFELANEVSTAINSKYFEFLLPQHQLLLNLYRSQPLISGGKYFEAIDLAQNTLTICKQHNLPKNNVYGLLSTIYSALGNHDDALQMDKENLTDILVNHPETKNALGQVYYSISRDFTNLGILDSANYYGVKSLNHWTHPISLIQLGDIKTKNNEFDSARFYFSEAEKVIRSKPQWKHQETTLYIFLSQLEINQKNWDKGLQYSENALDIALQQNDVAVSLNAYQNIVLSHLREKGYYLDSLLSKISAITDETVTSQTIEMDKKYKTYEKEKEILALNNAVQQQEIETLLFRNYLLFTGVGALIIIAFIYFLFKIKKNKNEKEMNKLNKQALQLQMNPHFFFNSLNSIHNFIGNNNVKEAQKYLINFSKLMRLTLENSQENLVSIKNEVEFLRNFLILERLRNKNFDFEIDVSEDLLEQKIPSFLIQPIIENSLIHGFSKIKYEGLVKLKIEKQHESMLITVIDNGIGRSKSIQQKDQNTTHQSFGIDILKKRITAHSKEKNTISIENGIPKENNLGTKISFKLPLFN